MSAKGVMVIRLAAVAVVLSLVGFIAWQHHKLSQAESQIRELKATPQVSLADGTVRASESTTETGGAEAAAEQMGVSLDQIRKDAAALGTQINSLVAGTIRTSGRRQVGVSSSASEARPDRLSAAAMMEAPPGVDRWSYTESRQILRLTEPFSGSDEVPWGRVGFSAWKREPWDVEVLPRSYKSFAVGSIGPDGKRHVYTQFVIEVAGKTYKLPVTTAQYVEDVPPSAFRWRLTPMLATSIGPFVSGPDGAAALPGIQFAMARYGSSGDFPLWIFLAPGVAYEPRIGSFALTIVPAAYNIGKPMPLLDNLYIGPSVGVQAGGGVSIGASLGVGL